MSHTPSTEDEDEQEVLRHGPYLIKSEAPLSVDELEQVLRAMPPDRRKAFLKGAAI